MLHAGNYGSYAIPISGGINMTGSYGLNDQRLYLRTNGDTNHFLWNADDDWEEIRAYSGTGFRIQSSNGSTIKTFAVSGNYSYVREAVQNGDNSGTLYGPNASWGAYLYVGAASNKLGSYQAQVISTDGNLHLDSASASKQMYLNYYSGQNIRFHGETNWYSNGRLNGYNIYSGNYLYLDNNYGSGIVGVYTSTRYQMVYAMGDAYKISNDGSATNNMYGIAWSHPNAGGQAGFLNDHGMLIMNYGTTFAAISSRAWFRQYVDATYYRDNESTGYYLNPAGDRDSNINGWNQTTQAKTGITGRYNYWRPYITGDQVYWTGNMGWGSYTFNEMLGWGSGFIDSWGSTGAQNRPGDTSHHVGIQTFHWSNGSNAYGWQMIGGVNQNLWWRYSWNSPSGWYKIAMYDNNSNTSALWATSFRDSNNGGYYLDPDGTSSLNAVYYYNLYWQGDSSYGVIGRNGYFDTVNGRGGDPLELNYYDGGEVRIGPGGGNKNVMANAFYKGVNTSYYCNPTGYSQLSSGEFNDYCRIARLDFTGVGGNSGQGTNAYSIFQEGGGWGYPYPDLRIAYHTGLKLGANAGSYEGVRLYSDYDMSGILIQLSGSSNYSFWHTWQNLTGHHGIYSGINGAHFYPSNRSYGSWIIDGNRNGWYGLSIGTGNSPYYMFDGSGNGGCYIEGYGRWVFYHSLGNNCTGMGTSSTAGGYAIYCNGGVYATGNIVAYSDIRKKKDIVTVDNALDKVLQLRGIYYTKIYNENDTIPDGGADKRQLGVIAQEVNEIVPEVVSYVKDLDEYAVAYGNLAGLFIEAFKEQNEIVKKQSEEIKELKEILNNLIFNIKG
jgi:hypothetical protein